MACSKATSRTCTSLFLQSLEACASWSISSAGDAGAFGFGLNEDDGVAMLRTLLPRAERPRVIGFVCLSFCIVAALSAGVYGGEAARRPDADRAARSLRLDRSRTSAALLAEAREALNRRQPNAAIHALQQLLDAGQDSFVTDGIDSGSFSCVRAEANRILANLAPEQLDQYERQFGPVGARALKVARPSRNVGQLAVVVNRFRNTRAGLQALRELAALHFDRGHFRLAAVGCQAVDEHPMTDPATRQQTHARLTVSLARSGQDDRVTAQDWLFTGGRLDRNSPCIGTLPAAQPLWRHNTQPADELAAVIDETLSMVEGLGIATLPVLAPLAVGETVVTRTFDRLVALDARTADVLWQKPAGLLPAAVANAPKRLLNGQYREVLGDTLVARLQIDSVCGTLSSDGVRVFVVEQRQGTARPRRPGRSWIDTSAMTNELAAYELSTGAKLWRTTASQSDGSGSEGTFFLGPPLPLDGTLYVVGQRHTEFRLLAIRPSDGEIQWSVPLAQTSQQTADLRHRRFACPVAFSDGILICPTASGGAVAVDLLTRSLRWAYSYDRDDIRPVLGPQPAQSDDGSIERWWGGWRQVTVLVDESRVFLASPESQAVHALDLDTGRRLWRRPRDRGLFVAGCFQSNVVIVEKNRLRARNAGTGETAWSCRLGAVSGHGFTSKQHYFVPLATGGVAAVDLSTGVVHRSNPTQKAPLGNLVARGDTVLSQTYHGISLHRSLGASRDAASHRLKERSDDTALFEQSLLDGEAGDFAAAANTLQGLLDTQGFRAGAEQLMITPADIRRHCLNMLLAELDEHAERWQQLAAKIRPLLETQEDRIDYLRALARAARRDGKLLEALKACLQLLDLDTAEQTVEERDGGRRLRIDRWVQAEITDLLAAANSEQRQQLETSLDDVHALPADSPVLVNLRSGPLRLWPEVAPTITTRENPALNDDIYFTPIPVEESRNGLFDRVNVYLQRMAKKVRFQGDGRSGFWEVPLPQSTSPHRYTPQLHRGWAVGHLLVLRVGSELFAIAPLDDDGEANAKLLWTRNTYEGSQETRTERIEAHLGFGPDETVHRDRFDRPIAQIGPVRPGYLCFQQNGTLIAVEPLTGSTLWIREDIPQDAVSTGDDEYVFLYRRDVPHVEVLRSIDGKTIAERRLEFSPRDILLQHGRTCIVAEPPGDRHADPYRILKADLVDGTTVWKRDFAVDAVPFALDLDTFGVLEPEDKMLIVSRRTGATLASHRVRFPARLARICCARDQRHFFIALSGLVADPAELQVKQIRRGYRNPLLHGPLYGLDRATGKLLWRTQLEDAAFALDQPKESPFLVLNYQTLAETNAGNSPSVGVVRCLDKNTGDELYRRTGPISGVYHALEANPPEKRVDIHFKAETIRLDFGPSPTSDERPVTDAAEGGPRSR